MNYKDFEILFNKNVPKNYCTKDIDIFNKNLIKNNIDVSFLKKYLNDNDLYHRTYFQVMLAKFKTANEQLDFIKENEYLLNDWWHVDQLIQFLKKDFDLEIGYKKAKEYVYSKHPFTRRLGYVMFMPKLVKDNNSFELIKRLLKNDDEYYVVMAEAWLISYLAIYYPEETIVYLANCNLNYNIVGKAIQKICDSFRISNEYKNKFKEIRKKYKKGENNDNRF